MGRMKEICIRHWEAIEFTLGAVVLIAVILRLV